LLLLVLGGAREAVLRMTMEKLEVARQMHDSGKHSVAAIAETVGVSRATLYRSLQAA
jgi:transposase-like protein